MKTTETIVAVALLLFAGELCAQTVKNAPTSAIVYKNGLAWVVEEGRGKTETDWVDIALHGVPLSGSLEIGAGNDGKVIEIVGAPAADRSYGSLADLLTGGAAGTSVTVHWTGGSAQGVFRGFTETMPGAVSMLTLAAGDKTTLIPTSQIALIELPSAASHAGNDEDAADRTEPHGRHLRVRISGGEGNRVFSATYATRGLGWVPTYLLAMDKDDAGLLAMDATVINDALDLASVQVRFATGEAAFPFKDQDSPLVSGGAGADDLMRSVMAQASQQGRGEPDPGQMYNAMQQYVPPRRGGAAQPIGPSEETHLYGPHEITLRKGERMQVRLGGGEVPASLVYYWQAPAYSSGDEANSVWLAALVKNKLSFPLTTGQILITQKGKPLGQGVVPYTHPDGEALVPIALASSVLCSAQEEETERATSTTRVRGSYYYRVAIAGTLTIANNRDRTVTVRVEKPVTGKVLKASRNGRIDARLVSPFDPNPGSRILWTVDVEKGKEVELRYSYETLVER